LPLRAHQGAMRLSYITTITMTDTVSMNDTLADGTCRTNNQGQQSSNKSIAV